MLENPEIRMWEYDDPSSNLLFFNLNNPYLSNRYVRQAITHAIPYELIRNEILPSWGIKTAYPGKTPITPLHYYTYDGTTVRLFNEDLAPYEYDIAKATEYMNMWLHSQPANASAAEGSLHAYSNEYGICILDGSNNIIAGNNVSHNTIVGIQVGRGTICWVFDNVVYSNSYGGIVLSDSNESIISGNFVSLNHSTGGIKLQKSKNCTAYGNVISNNTWGINLHQARDNKIYHNDFINNYLQFFIDESGFANSWDNGYPSGGNYWSDYTDIDVKSGSGQD